MIELPTLYPHQEDLRDRTRVALGKHRRVILCAPTGMGKTRLAKWILGATTNREPAENQSGKSLFTVHRRGLVDNAIGSFGEEPAIPHGVIMSGREVNLGYRIQIASIDTLLSWFAAGGEEFPSHLTFDLIVWDEAHSHHPKFAKVLVAHDKAREKLGLHPAYVIGLTATPEAEGLADVYGDIALGPSTEWLIEKGFLAPFRYFRATQGNLGLLVKRGNEFTKDSEAKAMEGLAGDLVDDWKRLADGRPTVGFFPRRSHAKDAMEQLGNAGLSVEYVDGETPDEERRRLYDALDNHRIDYLCNVQVVERGTDIPAIACVQLCVAIGSLVRYRQMIGRGSRTHPDKTDCVVLDHGGNVARHGFFEDDPPWNLDTRSKATGETAVRPTIECPKCNAIYRGGKCKACGYESNTKGRKAQGMEFDGRRLKEVTRTDKKPKGKTAEQLMVAALYKAGRSGRTWRQATGIFKGLNRSQGTHYRVPKMVRVGNCRYAMLGWDHPDSGRRVSDIYPFTKRSPSHGGDYLIRTEEVAESPY